MQSKLELYTILDDLIDSLKQGYRSGQAERIDRAQKLADLKGQAGLKSSTDIQHTISDTLQTQTYQRFVYPKTAKGSSLMTAPLTSKGARIQIDSEDTIAKIEEEVRSCRNCFLHVQRGHAVPGTGDCNNVQVMVVGEAPGQDEDIQGLPFVGRAGQYLDKWLSAINLSRENGVYITNIVKCRPPKNRDPNPTEQEHCMPYLLRQIGILNPRAILCLGRISASSLLGRKVTISRDRGKWFNFAGYPIIITYHPSAVLRDYSHRSAVWEDLQKLQTALESNSFA